MTKQDYPMINYIVSGQAKKDQGSYKPTGGGTVSSWWNSWWNDVRNVTNGGQAQKSDQRPTSAQQVKGPTTNSSYTPTYQSYGDYSAQQAAAAQRQQNIDLVNQLFDTRKAGLQGQLRGLDPQQDAAQGRIINQFTTKSNDLKENRELGEANLQRGENKVQFERAKSLGEIRDRLNSQALGYGNQLGTFGAGDSSAARMINTALSSMYSKNRGDVQRNASDQLTEIQVTRENLVRDYERNMRDLSDWKNNTLSDIATEFLQTKQKIQQAISQADAQRAQQLADYDAKYTQQAIDALKALENQYETHAGQLVNRYRNALAPQNIKIDSKLQDYAVKPISAGELRGIGEIQNVNTGTDAISAILNRRDEDESRTILGV